MTSIYKTKALWWLLFSAALLPLIYILLMAVFGDLGSEPAKAVVEFLGETALIFLIITLSISPVRKIPVFRGLVRYRRMTGLYVFFYALMHLMSYSILLVDWLNFLEDIYKRPYVTMGFSAFIILSALAVTSPKIMVKKLGRRWKPLHRFVYLAAILVLVHVWWQVRSDYTEAISYAAAVLFLLSFRFSYFRSLIQKA